MRELRVLAIVVAAATAVLVVLLPLHAIGVLPHPAGWPVGMLPFIAIAVLAPATVGLLIALRRPSNWIAWILLLTALTMALLANDAFLDKPWATHLGAATWPTLYGWPIAVAYVFPNGRLLTRRWRWVAGGAVFSFVAFMAFAMASPSEFEDTDPSVRNPLAHNAVGEWLERTGLGSIWVVFWLGILASLFAGALAIRLRLRRSTGIERLQTLWLAWATSLIPLALLACGLSWFVLSDVIDAVVVPVLLITQAGIAIAIGIAVARYHLYAIERLINRTVVYALLTVSLAGTYVAITVPLGVLLGRGSAWVTAAATFAVAIAFRPLRGRLQTIVDRRFDRARFDAVRRVRTFEEQVREGVRTPEEIGAVLAEALRDTSAELLFWLPASETLANALGEVSATPDHDTRARTEIRHDGNLTALLLHDPVLLERRVTLDSVLSAAALSIEIARLRVEVRRQLAEVEASRRRIVEAGYEERRRLERDLHDGAQQRLVSLGIVLRRLQRSLPPEARLLAPALDAAVDEVGAAVADLRTIAAGVRPPRLDDGLAAALRDLARTAPLRVDVDARVDRVAASVEAAAYFVACEALTNAVKHAAASRVALHAVRENGSLLLTISDDGVGGAVAHRGSGLAGLHDRVAAHGGSLEIVSPRGSGTRIEVAIPCES